VLESLTLFGAWAPVLAVQAAHGGWITARHRTVRPLARLAVLALLLAGSVVAAKAGFGRVPPYFPDALWSGGRSYPSGHTATAVALWGLGASVAADWCGARTRRLTRTVSVLAPALTGTAMVLLRYHWLTDVVAGAAIGVLLLALLRGVDRVALAHLPGADRGIARAGDHDGGRLVAARGARRGGDRRPVHDPRPADR
jgi:membrane-associated phospholipid phosphatase